MKQTSRSRSRRWRAAGGNLCAGTDRGNAGRVGSSRRESDAGANAGRDAESFACA